MRTKKNRVNTTVMVSWQRPFKIAVFIRLIRLHHCHVCNLNISRLVCSSFFFNLRKYLNYNYLAVDLPVSGLTFLKLFKTNVLPHLTRKCTPMRHLLAFLANSRGVVQVCRSPRLSLICLAVRSLCVRGIYKRLSGPACYEN
jgi:hypothetical protein